MHKAGKYGERPTEDKRFVYVTTLFSDRRRKYPIFQAAAIFRLSAQPGGHCL